MYLSFIDVFVYNPFISVNMLTLTYIALSDCITEYIKLSNKLRSASTPADHANYKKMIEANHKKALDIVRSNNITPPALACEIVSARQDRLDAVIRRDVKDIHACELTITFFRCLINSKRSS